MKYPWFKRKRYGWGWTPCTWQGWMVMFVYVALLVGIFSRVDTTSHSVSDTLSDVALPLFVLSGVLVLISYLTGESPRWQWGDDDATRSH